MFRNRATVLVSNDPAALPPQPQVLAPQTITNPVATVPKASLEEVKPKEGMLSGFKKLFSFGGNKPYEVAAPTETAPIAASSAISPEPIPAASPASINMDGLKPDERPNVLNSLQQLFN
jgi:hypothetical protein